MGTQDDWPSIAPADSDIDWGPVTSTGMARCMFAWCESHWREFQIGVALRELQADADNREFLGERAEHVKRIAKV